MGNSTTTDRITGDFRPLGGGVFSLPRFFNTPVYYGSVGGRGKESSGIRGAAKTAGGSSQAAA